jgi:hypothetical protein
MLVSVFVFYSHLYFYCCLEFVRIVSGHVAMGRYGLLSGCTALLLAETGYYNTLTHSRNRVETYTPPPVVILK